MILYNYITSTGITNDQICFDFDEKFHESDSIFEANHMVYSHHNDGDDHAGSWSMGTSSSTNDGMMSNGNMNDGSTGDGYNTTNCTQNNLDIMDGLMTGHEQYHSE